MKKSKISRKGWKFSKKFDCYYYGDIEDGVFVSEEAFGGWEGAVAIDGEFEHVNDDGFDTCKEAMKATEKYWEEIKNSIYGN